jgi:hypothetical protein
VAQSVDAPVSQAPSPSTGSPPLPLWQQLGAGSARFFGKTHRVTGRPHLTIG